MKIRWIMAILKYYRSLKHSKCLYSFFMPPGQNFLILVFQKVISPTTYYFITHEMYIGSTRRYQQPTCSYTFLFLPSVSRLTDIYLRLTLRWITKSLERPSMMRAITKGHTAIMPVCVHSCTHTRFVCLINANRILIFTGKMFSVRNSPMLAKVGCIFARERPLTITLGCVGHLMNLACLCLLHSFLTIQKRPCVAVNIYSAASFPERTCLKDTAPPLLQLPSSRTWAFYRLVKNCVISDDDDVHLSFT